MADKLAKLKEAALRLSNELWKVDTRAEAVSWCAAADEVLRAFAAAPQAPSEPTDEQIRAGVRAFQSGHNGFDDLSDWRAFYRTVRALAGQQSERPAPAGQAVGDAARYRVLREHQHGFRAYRLQPKQGKRWRGWSDEGAILKGDELDAAIDAALAASQAERPAVKEDGNGL